MTNRAHTATDADAETEFHDMMARFDELHGIRLAKYGLSPKDIPNLLRIVESFYDEGRLIMEPNDERMTLIYLGMKEIQNTVEATMKLTSAYREIAQLKKEVGRLNDDINALHHYCGLLESRDFHEDDFDEDGSSLVVGV